MIKCSPWICIQSWKFHKDHRRD